MGGPSAWRPSGQVAGRSGSAEVHEARLRCLVVWDEAEHADGVALLVETRLPDGTSGWFAVADLARPVPVLHTAAVYLEGRRCGTAVVASTLAQHASDADTCHCYLAGITALVPSHTYPGP